MKKKKISANNRILCAMIKIENILKTRQKNFMEEILIRNSPSTFISKYNDFGFTIFGKNTKTITDTDKFYQKDSRNF